MKTLGIILIVIVLIVILYVVYKNTIGKTSSKDTSTISNITSNVSSSGLGNGAFVDANGNVIHNPANASGISTGQVNPNSVNEILSYSQDLNNACTNLQKLLSSLNYIVSTNGNTVIADGRWDYGSDMISKFAARFTGNHNYTGTGYNLWLDNDKLLDYVAKGYVYISYNNTDKANCLRIINIIINYWGSSFLGIS